MATPPNDGIALDRVSLHAITRYVQRVLGVQLDIDAEATSPEALASAHCYAAGVGMDEVRARILSPAVRMAIQQGVPAVRTGDFRVKMSDTGVVVTVEATHQHRRVPKNDLSRREQKRHRRRKSVRRRRRPK